MVVPLVQEMPGGFSEIAFTVVSLILMAGANVLVNMLNYGLCVLITRLVERKYVTIGFMFIGFRENTKKVFLSSLIFTAIYSFVIILLSVLMVIFRDSILPLMTTNPELLAIYLGLIAFILLFIFISPFAFVNIIIYLNPSIKIGKAFSLSFKLMISNYFHAVGFMFYCGGINLIVAIVVNVMNSLIPSSLSQQPGLSFIIFMLSITGFICELKAIVNMYVSVPLYYFTKVDIIKREFESDEAEVLTDQSINDNPETLLIDVNSQDTEEV